MPITNLQDKKCLITGAGSGIGRALAHAADREGATLFLTDINAAALDETVAAIRNQDGNVQFSFTADIADHAAVAGMAATVHANHGSLDVIMNVAGISTWGAIEHLHHDDWRRNIEVNLMGPIHVLENFIPSMIKAGRGGYVVNVASAAGLLGLPWHAAYSASKFGLRGVSEVLRFDLKRHGIGVSLVCPGGVDTGLVQTVQIRGIDNSKPDVIALKQTFRKHAVSAENVATTILKGIKANRYMIFTSADIRTAYWLQRYCPPLYGMVMTRLNNYLIGKLHQ